jgi:hypothetical protein
MRAAGDPRLPGHRALRGAIRVADDGRGTTANLSTDDLHLYVATKKDVWILESSADRGRWDIDGGESRKLLFRRHLG